MENHRRIAEMARMLAAQELNVVVSTMAPEHQQRDLVSKILQEKLSLNDLPKTEERIEAGLAEAAVAVLNGATIIRTHDVLQTKKFLAVLDELK